MTLVLWVSWPNLDATRPRGPVIAPGLGEWLRVIPEIPPTVPCRSRVTARCLYKPAPLSKLTRDYKTLYAGADSVKCSNLL